MNCLMYYYKETKLKTSLGSKNTHNLLVFLTCLVLMGGSAILLLHVLDRLVLISLGLDKTWFSK